MNLVDPVALALLLVANGAPLLAAQVARDRGKAPLDGGRRWRDGRPLFGPHKTWRGLLAALLASAATGAVLGLGAGLGALAGALAMTGDLASSFVKRRLGHDPGREALLLDQLPESLLPLLGLAVPLGLGPATIALTALVFATVDVLASRALR